MLVSRPARHESASVTQLASCVSAGQVVATAVGARDSIRLPDGTAVLLGPASRLTLSASYGRGGREVSLDGIARFAVQHDSSAPFVVRAGAAIVRDVGTVFMVRASGDSRQPATVAVTEGAVSLASDRARATPVRLGAGDRGELRADGEVVAQRGSVGDGDFAWTRGILDFNDAPMAQVRDELQRWYGVELRVDSTLATRRLTATFGREPVDEVLRSIALAVGADVTRDGAVATLRAGGAPR
jgi:transmembrane sensor